MSLKNKTALVTGGGRGIGLAIATELHRKGCKLVLVGRNEERLNQAAATFEATAWQADLGNSDSLGDLLLKIENHANGIDILVNNAGVAKSASLKNASDEEWRQMLGVNAFAPFKLIQKMFPIMKDKGWGRIVNIASNAGVSGYNYSSVYCASKHALVGMTRALAVEIATSSVTINAVCPGWVDTDLAKEAIENISSKTGRDEKASRAVLAKMSPQNRIISPEEVAHVVSMLCSDDARSIHGQALVVDGGQILK